MRTDLDLASHLAQDIEDEGAERVIAAFREALLLHSHIVREHGGLERRREAHAMAYAAHLLTPVRRAVQSPESKSAQEV